MAASLRSRFVGTAIALALAATPALAGSPTVSTSTGSTGICGAPIDVCEPALDIYGPLPVPPLPPPLITAGGPYGLGPGDDITALSLGFDAFTPATLAYVAVGPATVGCPSGGPPDVCSESSGVPCGGPIGEHVADVFFTGFPGFPTPNGLTVDGDGTATCLPPPPPTFPGIGLIEPGDGVNALAGCSLATITATSGPPPIFFTLAPGSPTLGGIGATPFDVLVSVPPGPPGVAIPGGAFGLGPGDHIDAVAFDTVTPDLWFSLAPGSPTLGLLGATPADILSTGPGLVGPLFIAHPGALFGLAALTDDVDGLMVITDGDGDLVDDACDNCVGVPNNDQADSNLDGVGDACSPTTTTTSTTTTTTSTTTTTTLANLVGHKVSVSKYGGSPAAGKLYKIVIKAKSDGNEIDYPSGFPLPTDPATNGGSVKVSRDGGTLTDPLTGGTWKGLGNPAGSKGWKYKNTSAPSGGVVKIALIKSKVIKLVAKGTGTMPVPTASNGTISTTIVADDQRYCAEADAPHFREVAGKLIKSKSSTETLKPLICASPSGAFLDLTGGLLD